MHMHMHMYIHMHMIGISKAQCVEASRHVEGSCVVGPKLEGPRRALLDFGDGPWPLGPRRALLDFDVGWGEWRWRGRRTREALASWGQGARGHLLEPIWLSLLLLEPVWLEGAHLIRIDLPPDSYLRHTQSMLVH